MMKKFLSLLLHLNRIDFPKVMKRDYFLSLIFILSLFLFYCKGNDHGFDKGLHPIPVNFSKNLSSLDCKECHEEIYEEWKTSRHRDAYTNRLYQESYAREPLTWCTNCHAPFLEAGLDANQPELRFRKEEGVSCLVCHVREDKILVSSIPKKPKEHRYIESPYMKESEFCGSCHQFNFPVGTGKEKDFQFSHLPMQNTFQEWQNSFYYQKETCQDCHQEYSVGKNRYRTHYFPGGHSIGFLNKTFQLNFYQVSNHELELELVAKNLGHAFPTGDLFRKLLIRILGKEKNEIAKLEFQYEYKDFQKNKKELYSRTSSSIDDHISSVEERRKNKLPSKQLIKKDILQEPLHQRDAKQTRRIYLGTRKVEEAQFYELSISYLSNTNQLWTKLPKEATNPIIRIEKLQVKKRQTNDEG
jgi:hypothetical protein